MIDWTKGATGGGGSGKILPVNSSEPVNANWKRIISKDGFKTLDIGDSISFLRSEGDPQNANLIVKIYPLRRFAELPPDELMLEDLHSKLLKGENWSYAGSQGPYPILYSYLFYTFERLEEEDRKAHEDRKKIKIAQFEERLICAFNTGLVTPIYKPIFAVFEENPPLEYGKQRWRLVGFCSQGEKINQNNYLTAYDPLPERADYFDKPADLIFDYKLRLDAVTEHILSDRRNRIPDSLYKSIPEGITDDEKIKAYLSSHLENAISRAKERIKWNYKTAIPQYYPPAKKIQLLLPLCLHDHNKVDLALAVQRENKAYVGFTILELDWAYSNARLIARPDSDWLSPDKIESQDEE